MIIIALLSSPVILAITQHFLARTPQQKQMEKIEEIRKSLEEYKIEQATTSLAQKNWRVIESAKPSPYLVEEWLILYNNLLRLLPESEWGHALRNESILAQRKIRSEVK